MNTMPEIAILNKLRKRFDGFLRRIRVNGNGGVSLNAPRHTACDCALAYFCFVAKMRDLGRMSRPVLGALAVFICLQSSLPCRAQFTPTSGVGYRIEDKSSGYMFWENIYNGSQRVPLTLMGFRAGGDTTWTFADMGNGYYQILNPLRNLVVACDPNDSGVYLEVATNGDAGQLWSPVNETNGYVAILNKMNGLAITIQNPPGEEDCSIGVAANTQLANQQFWVAPVEVNPVQTIAVPAGYNVNAAKRIVLCSTNNRGSSITGTITGSAGSTNVTLNYAANLWGQYYYLYIDTTFASTTDVYTVTAPGFSPASFEVSDDYYRATPDGIGGKQGITNILDGFFAWQREKGPQTNMAEIFFNADGSYETVDYGGDLHGGWKDATSTDIETIQDAAALRNLSYAAEDTVNAGDRTDLLAEVAFGADFFTRYQNPDGSFPVHCEPDSTSYGPNGFITANVDCGITARAVIGLAAAARVLRGYNNTLATQCLNAASNGWNWVEANQNNYITNNLVYESYWWGNADSVLGAALELAITAPNTTMFQTNAAYFFNDGEFNSSGDWVKKAGFYVHQSGGEDAAIGLARYYQMLPSTNELKASIATQLMNYYNAMSASINTPFGTDSGTFNGGFGENEVYSTQAYIYLNVYRALGDGQILDTAQDYMNWLYGANPFGSSFIIGFGYLNVVPQYARPRPGSIGEIIPGILTTTNSPASLTTWGGIDYAVGEGGVADTSVLPAYMALMDHDIVSPTLTPVAHYSFDDVSGSTVINNGSGGAAMNGVLTNGAVIVPGIIGNAVALSNGALVFINSGITGLSGDGTWTVAAWIKTTQTGASLFSKGDGTNWSDDNSTFYLTDGSVSGGGKPGAVRYAQNWLGNSALPNINDGNWHWVAYEDNAGTKSIYVDGVDYPVPNDGWGASTGDIGNKIWLGWTSLHDGSTYLNGLMDEVWFFNTALSPDQMLALYNQTTTPIIPPTLTVTSFGSNTIMISWPLSAVGFALQTNADLNAAEWESAAYPISTNGMMECTTINLPKTGNLFFRLFHP